MNIRLDENLGDRGAAILRAAGHHVTTVAEEGLSSASDQKLAEVCRSDRKCLVTLDLDFRQPVAIRSVALLWYRSPPAATQIHGH